MAYQKQDFVKGQTLTADNLNHIEEGIIELDEKQNNFISTSEISLKVCEDGGLYLFINNEPVGDGIYIINNEFSHEKYYIDDNNELVLLSNLDNDTYTLKYVNEDGTYTVIGSFEINEEGGE
jgi:hypothetical protein